MRPLLAALVAALALAVAPAPGTAAAAEERREKTRMVDLGGDQVGRHARSALARGRTPTWPLGKIRYYESIPAKWQWGLDRAISQWNSAGSKIKFVKVGSARRAQVKISYGNTGGADGLGGWQAIGNRIRSGFVRLSPKYKQVNQWDDEQRVWVGRLFTHELGHVLGFGHTSQRCSLMAPIFYFGACGPLSVDKPGYYQCRWIDAPLLKRFIAIYGGHAKRPPADCLIYPLPPRLTGVTFAGGAVGESGGGPVRITWTKIVAPAAGTYVRISVWPASSCATKPPGSAETYEVEATSSAWSDPREATGPGCYHVQAVNHSGIGQAPTTKVMQRYAPTPVAPILSGPVTYDPVEFGWVVGATAPIGDIRFAVRAGACPGTVPAPEEFFGTYSPEEGLYLVYEAGEGLNCAYAAAFDQFGRQSPVSTIEWTVPPNGG